MATVQFFSGMNMNKFDWFGWPDGGAVDYKNNQIGIYDGDGGFEITKAGIFGGSFSYDNYTDSAGTTHFLGLSSGTLNSYKYYVNDLIDVSIQGFSIDAVVAFNYMTLGNTAKSYNIELLRNILSGADFITGSAFDDSLRGFGGNDWIEGGARNDRVSGESGNDTLFGGSGTDIVAGGTGNDIITGGANKDTLTGGANQDRFNYTLKTEGGDHITDFSNLDDTLTFSSSGFGNHAVGTLKADEFQRGTSDVALTADVRFFYETDTGILRYDSNGSAAGGATVIATLDGAPDLYRLDLLII